MCKVENFRPSFKDVNEPVEIHLLSRELGRRSLLRCQKSDGKRVVGCISSHYDQFLQHLAALEGDLPLRAPVTAFLATNVLIFTAPFKSLAETCEADNSIFNMPLLLLVALIGATVGGLLARQRRGELQRVNEQLRQINTALRRQAKIESYAPTLSYAPVVGRISEEDIIVDPRKEELISQLKNGKNHLRNQEPEKAFLEFQTALELARSLKDPIEEKKASRGLGIYHSVLHCKGKANIEKPLSIIQWDSGSIWSDRRLLHRARKPGESKVDSMTNILLGWKRTDETCCISDSSA
ncbi:Protein FLUORESCENT IN BLUE LIGHT [Hibiscus syriacus]|uniref:Protein FLUORESCENT IN BLUE LIGHT n=1 Tax=Hibiscus syriacus TaxID=106335 RepID=A0A6A2XG61_HIBSY|nr:Protein FLUORESCENT IN BLUE LIGHT [Hibiscus syriacus]